MIDKQNKILNFEAHIESTELIEIHELTEVTGTRVVFQHDISLNLSVLIALLHLEVLMLM